MRVLLLFQSWILPDIKIHHGPKLALVQICQLKRPAPLLASSSVFSGHKLWSSYLTEKKEKKR
jgi:hypothetical protein